MRRIPRCRTTATGLVNGDEYMCIKPAKHAGAHEWSWKGED